MEIPKEITNAENLILNGHFGAFCRGGVFLIEKSSE